MKLNINQAVEKAKHNILEHRPCVLTPQSDPVIFNTMMVLFLSWVLFSEGGFYKTVVYVRTRTFIYWYKTFLRGSKQLNRYVADLID